MEPRKRLGERLIEAGLITHDQLAQALRTQERTGRWLGETLVELEYVAEDELVRALCTDAAIPFLDLAVAPRGPLAASLPEMLARSSAAIPVGEEQGRLTVALANPFNVDAVLALERAAGRPIVVVGAPRARIMAALDAAYQRAAAAMPEAIAVAASGPGAGGGVVAYLAPEEAEDGGSAASIVDDLIRRATTLGATDVHLEPREASVVTRFRVDGMLREGPSYPKSVQNALVTRLKIMAGINIAENRMPQDGRLRARVAEHDVDVRLSTFPTMHGEDCVLRLLDQTRLELKLERLGMGQEDVRLFREVLRRPHGLVLVTGPTGSGKTTTLYAALAEMDTSELCVLTLEDPIEYELPGIRQSQINVRAGLTFASGLRSMLRHDPDVILVGEMRDGDTVQIGLSAALTGHLVLTTLHTSSAAGAIPRMLDMGAEPYVLASTLQMVVAQRLARRLCPECRIGVELAAAMRKRYNLEGARVYKARGCAACNQTGYRGRVGLFEVLPVTAEVAELIHDRAPVDRIQKAPVRPSLLQDGLRKVRGGITSLEEIFRVLAAPLGGE